LANEVVVLRDGEEAVQYVQRKGSGAQRSDAIPSLVLLDLKLPKRDGFEVLEAIRADPEWRDVPVVALTSSNQEEDIERAYRSGANSFVRKPVLFEEFVRSVSTVGCYWLLLNEPPR
jgi:CheY-like chemotaxis protein